MRIAAQVGCNFLFLLFVSALWHRFLDTRFRPDFISVMAAYLGLTSQGRLSSTLVAAIVIGYLADLLYGTPVGIMATSAGLVVLLCHIIQGRLLLRGVFLTFVFSTILGAFSAIVTVIVLQGFGLISFGLFHELFRISAIAIATGLAGPFLFWGSRQIDARFARTPRARAAAAAGMF